MAERMKIYFVTTNKHKVEEVKAIIGKLNIEVVQLPEEKYEHKEMELKEVTEFNAKRFYEKHKKPIVVEDTGVFFDAYPGFPGSHPKLMFALLGYKGLLRLVAGESRKAHFKSVATYYDGKNMKTFEGTLDGVISDTIHDEHADVLPYERIFLVDGKPLSSFSREEKNRISHRSKAFVLLGEWLTKAF
jgi:XTP/dITP diphosphohydrolase